MFFIKTIAVLGAGLLGGSIAKAAKARGLCDRISVWSRGESTRAKCSLMPDVFDEICDTPQQAAREADFIFLCTPTDNIPQLANEIVDVLKPSVVVTDVGSVKAKICAECSKIFSGRDAKFIGSHPMAGSEKIGVNFSDENLFAGRVCFVTDSQDASAQDAHKLVSKFWNALGMRVETLSPELHDEVVAKVSHLPHLLSGTLCNFAASFENFDLANVVGPGFRDCTRVSSGSPAIWDSIVADNRVEILSALCAYKAKLDSLIEIVKAEDAVRLAEFLRSAKTFRDRL